MKRSLGHLSLSDHEEAGRLLKQVQNDLVAVTRIVKRAPFTDDTLRVMKRVQETLIDPLSETLRDLDEREDRHRQEGLYP